MTELPSSSRWPRFIPKQFSIGALLVLITVVACILWWYVQLPIGIITEQQIDRLVVGMTAREVQRELGNPYKKTSEQEWEYRLVTPDGRRITICFDRNGYFAESIVRLTGSGSR
jgi:outer membrane protein assembly factor BamE (lipoprotein component of BamABCDE complex)